MPDVTANGIRIHYERTGGAKPPLVLCHGVTDTGQCWPRIVAALSTDHDVITLDARGHGRSEAPAHGYSWDILGEDIAAVIQALGLTRPGIMGHSMGAATAAIAAANHPDVAGYLVLEDPPWRDPEPEIVDAAAHAETWRKSIVDRKGLATEQMVTYSIESNPGVARWDKIEFGPWSEAKRQVSLNILELFRARVPSWTETARRIACPTLLITADVEKGAIVSAQAAQKASALNSKIKTVHIAGAGHNIRREEFDAYLAQVRAFLKTVHS